MSDQNTQPNATYTAAIPQETVNIKNKAISFIQAYLHKIHEKEENNKIGRSDNRLDLFTAIISSVEDEIAQALSKKYDISALEQAISETENGFKMVEEGYNHVESAKQSFIQILHNPKSDHLLQNQATEAQS